MKGLDIAKAFYLQWGKTTLETYFPELVERVAVGRLSGSDVLRADDEISKDHNWGPQFTIFLSKQDFASYSERLATVMNAKAPNPWNGFCLDGGDDQSVQVECIPQLIKRWTGFSNMPQHPEDWNVVVREAEEGGTHRGHESGLYFFRHGAIWFDGTGELSRWREELHYYPKSIWRRRLAEEIFQVWHYGEYNFVQRVAKRHDRLTKAMCLGQFISSTMGCLLLLNQDYVPYWKWVANEFRKLEDAQQYSSLLEELVVIDDTDRQVEIVIDVSAKLDQKLKRMGLISEKKFNEYLLPLLDAHFQLIS